MVGVCPGGNDIVYGYGDSDIIYGNAGKDTIYGGFGPDTLFGGNQVDMLYGGPSKDVSPYSNAARIHCHKSQANMASTWPLILRRSSVHRRCSMAAMETIG